MKKCISVALAVIMLLCLMPTISVFAAKEETIKQLDLTITAPADGEKPAYDKIEGRGYYSDNGLQGISTRIYKNGVAWFKNASSYFSPGTTAAFEGGKTYTVKINLLAKGNFSFSENVTATVNGKAATVEIYDDGSILVEADLTAETVISKVDLSVVKPVAGKFPTFAKVDTTQYFSEKYGTVSNCTNGVTWTNQSSGVNLTISNLFKADVKYKLSYYLTAKDGYKFASTTQCTINGAAAVLELKDYTHAVVSLSDIIPGDGKKEIDSIDISVKAPLDGEKPDYTKIEETGYYSDNGIHGTSTKIYKNGIAWFKSSTSYFSPGTTETFKSGTEYTVKIALTPKDGYKFGTSVTAKINGKAATVESFDDGSINVSVKLTAQAKECEHTPSTWRTTGIYHYKVCTSCGEFLEQEEHNGGAATCSEKGKCTVCGYAYIEGNENHNADTSKWTACGNLYHAHLCKDCGAHAIIEDHKAGPAATETEPQKCTVCGYIIEPAKNHTHSLKKVAQVEATCTDPGNVEHYSCDGCSAVFADSDGNSELSETVIAPLGHIISDDWAYDKNHHWRTCTVCGEVLTETEMAHQVESGKCTTCGYEGIPPETTNPDASDTIEPDNSEPKGNAPVDTQNENDYLIWIILGAVLVMAAGAVVAVVVIKKKKQGK